MSWTLLDTIAVLALLWLLAKAVQRKGATYAHLPYPPGPKKLPFVENMLDIPRARPWLTYTRWAKELDTNILHTSTFGTHTVVLNDISTCLELLEKRSSLYSDRPMSTMAQDLVNYKKWNLGMMPYGNDWRDCRRMFHQQLHPKAAQMYHSNEALIARRLLRRLVERPDGYAEHIRFATTELALNIAYGIMPKDEENYFVKLAKDANESLGTAQPGIYLVDTFPFLKHVPSWLPGAHFKRQAAIWRHSLEAMYTEGYKAVKKDMAQGIQVPPSIVSAAISASSATEMSARDEYLLQAVTGVMYQASSDTTGTAMTSFIAAMVLHPESQRLAQEEIDCVVGTERLPNAADQSSLPYVRALIREVLRWRPVVPLGVAHTLMEDDEFQGYYLPKGSIVLANIWMISRDERIYSGDLEAFDPSRFLTPSGEIDKSIRDSSFVFGFGRRICAGRYLANDTLFIVIASILATLNIGKADGDAEDNELEFEGDFISYPKPFKCSIKPRSALSKELIMQELL